MARQFKDLTGSRFGRLVAITSFIRGKYRYWHCVCDCGSEKDIQSGHLFSPGGSETVRSCGCLMRDVNSVRLSTHGLTRHQLYPVWQGFKMRCNQVGNKDYERYGGRGIKYYSEWGDFQEFYNWAISAGWESGLTLDRKDVNGDYSPDNCRFVTQKVQQNNRRNNKVVTYKGKTGKLSEFLLDSTYKRAQKVRLRLWYGWSVERAIDTP